jgi:hypothetical protein
MIAMPFHYQKLEEGQIRVLKLLPPRDELEEASTSRSKSLLKSTLKFQLIFDS